MPCSPSFNSALAPLLSASGAFARSLARFSALLSALGTAVLVPATGWEAESKEAEEATLRAGVGLPRIVGARTYMENYHLVNVLFPH